MMPDPTPRRDRPSPARTRAPVELAAGATAVVFTWIGDRWQHAVAMPGGARAESVEGGGDGHAAWPASPPLVELSWVDTGAAGAVVAVGLAGRSHFSASVTVHPQLADTLLFEIACRLQEPPEWLGSTYRHGGVVSRLTADRPAGVPATMQWAYLIGPRGIRPVAGCSGTDAG